MRDDDNLTAERQTFVTHLECSATGARYPADKLHNLSRERKPLLVRYDLEAIKKELSKEALAGRPRDLWRYRELLPVRRAPDIVSLGEPITPRMALGALLTLGGLAIIVTARGTEVHDPGQWWLGFGCALATACDVTIAADNAIFKLPEMTHNLPPTLAISALMPKVPRKAIAYMVYAMPQIDAATALQIGIVSAVVPLARLDAAMAEALATMTSRSQAALVAVKDYLRSAPTMEPRGAAAYGAALLSGVLTSAGH